MVLGWNEESEIDRHLRELEELLVPQETELIAVVGGEDNTYEIYQSWCKNQDTFDRAECIEQVSEDGYAGAIERGMQNATGELIFQLEMDTVVPSDWLKKGTEALNEYDAISFDGEPRSGFNLHHVYQWINQQKSLTQGAPHLSGAQTIGLHRYVAEDVILDPENPLERHLVDWHICRRVLEQGYQTGRVTDLSVKVDHVIGRTSYDAFRKMQRNSLADIGDLRTLAIQGGKFTLASSAPFIIAVAIMIRLYFNLRVTWLLVIIAVSSVPLIVTLRDNLQDVLLASRSDSTAWVLCPAYLFSKQLFYFARLRTIFERLIESQSD